MKKMICSLLILSVLFSFAVPSSASENEKAWFGTLAVEYSDNIGSTEQLNVMVKDGFVYANGEELVRRLGYQCDVHDTGLNVYSYGNFFIDAAPYLEVYFKINDTTVDYVPFSNAMREYTAPAPCVKNDQGIWIPLCYSLLLLGGNSTLLGDTLVIQMPRQNAMSIANIIYFNGNILSFDWEDDFGYSESTSKRTDGASRTITLLNGLLTFDGTAWLSVVDWDAFDRKFGHTLTGMICTESQEEFRASLEEVETLLDVFSPTGKAGELLRDMQGDIDLDVSSWKIVCDRYLKLLEEGSGSTSEYNKLYQQYESAMDERALFAALGGEGAIHIQNQLSAATDVLDKLANIGNAVTYFNEFQQKDVFAMSVLDNYLNTRRSTNYLPDATAQAMHSRLNVMKKDGLLYSGYRFLQDNWLEKAVDFTQIDKLLGGPANVALFAWDIMSSTVPFYSDGLKSVEKREISNYAQKLQNDAWSNLFDMLTRLKTEARQPSKKECAELAEYCYVYLKSCYIARSAAIDSLDMENRSDEFEEKITGKLETETNINKKIAQYLAVLSRASEDSGYDVLGGLPEQNEDFYNAASNANLISVIAPFDTTGEAKQLTAVVVTKDGRTTRNITLTYDQNGRIQEVADQYLDESGEVYSVAVEQYVYDTQGNLIRQESEYPDYPGYTFVDEYVYDNHGNLISSAIEDSGGWSNMTYEYNSKGQLIRTTEEIQIYTLVTEYVYSTEGILTEAKLTYDEYGNVSVHKRTYEYDSNQNLIRMATTGPDGTEVETYEYDSQGRQVKIILESSWGITCRTFEYDYRPFVVYEYDNAEMSLRLDNWLLYLGNARLNADEDGYLTSAYVPEWDRTYDFYYKGDMIPSDTETQTNGREHANDGQNYENDVSENPNIILGTWYSESEKKAYVFTSTGSDWAVAGSELKNVCGNYVEIDFTRNKVEYGGYDVKDTAIIIYRPEAREYSLSISADTMLLKDATYKKVSAETKNQILGKWVRDDDSIEFKKDEYILYTDGEYDDRDTYYVISENLIAINGRAYEYTLNGTSLKFRGITYTKEGSDNSIPILEGLRGKILGAWIDDMDFEYVFFEDGTYQMSLLSYWPDGTIWLRDIWETGYYEICDQQTIKIHADGFYGYVEGVYDPATDTLLIGGGNDIYVRTDYTEAQEQIS